MTGPEVKLYRAKDEYVRYFSESCSCGKPEQTGNSGGELIKASEVLKSGSEDIFIAEILGDSMIEADIKRGDLVVINTQVPAKDGDVVLAMLDDEYLLKFLKVDGQGNKWLVPANPKYPSIKVDERYASTAIIGVMASLVRSCPRPSALDVKRFTAMTEKMIKKVMAEEQENKEFYRLIPNELMKSEILRRLHNLLDGQSGITVVKMLRTALMVRYLIEMPSHGMLKREFDVDIQSGFYYRERDKMFLESELENYKDSLLQ